jgi:chemotaxis protein histidine kinase CheA
VIKPLEDHYTACGPFSGATIREDGDVSLILDVVQVVRVHQASCRMVTRRIDTNVAMAAA